MIIVKVLFFSSIIMIFHTFIGYPISLLILSKFISKRKDANLEYRPNVSVIIPAHNEEHVIIQKLNNLISLEYPKDKLEIIVASDNSTDNTNPLVQDFINKHDSYNIRLYEVKERKGKTNAQNEAVRIASGEILVFTDANSMLEKKSIIHLVSSFTSSDIIYVTGQLRYTNQAEYKSSEAESKYWNYDLFMRKIESDIQTITAGNGALYAIRKSDYINFDPIESHDSAMPLEAALRHKRAIYNEKAIAYEKAGETIEDEFKRKVRMSRQILTFIFGRPAKYNIFKYKWFTYFYFSHRTLRYSLFILHPIALVTNLVLVSTHTIYAVLLTFQLAFYLMAIIGKIGVFKTKLVYYPYYYTMTTIAQLIGAYNQITGKSKPFWEKAESTR